MFTTEHVEMLSAVCSQATIALQNAQLYQSLQQEKNRIVEIGENERKKLARDLHDGPTQSIAAIAMRINYTRKLLEREPDKVDAELAKIEDLARRTTKEIRHMLFTLRPLVLETQGLVAALQQSIQKILETDSGVAIHLEAESRSKTRLTSIRKASSFTSSKKPSPMLANRTPRPTISGCGSKPNPMPSSPKCKTTAKALTCKPSCRLMNRAAAWAW